MGFHTEIDMSKGKLCYGAQEPNMVIFFVLLQMSVSSYSKTMQRVQAKIVAQMAFKVSKNLLNLLHDLARQSRVWSFRKLAENIRYGQEMSIFLGYVVNDQVTRHLSLITGNYAL